MTAQTPKSALMSKTMRFLTAGGLTLAVAILQEASRPDVDWPLVATLAAGLIVGIGGGAYGRVVAEGPITSLLPPAGGAR